MSSLVNVAALREFLVHLGQQSHADAIIDACNNAQANRHGRLPKWLNQLQMLPDIEPDEIELKDCVRLAVRRFDRSQSRLFEQQLLEFSPWRKGPVDLLGVHIDTEWRSDLKWRRLVDHLDLDGRQILDVGCGNGYYMFRMLGAGARSVMGVDPVALYVTQFLVINKYLKSDRLQLLPIGIEALPIVRAFDVVFSMGVLYHRRSHADHLSDLKIRLKGGGQLVLETLVLSGNDDDVLVPRDRYAGMKNVWAVPTVPRLIRWMEQAGFRNIKVLDLSKTTLTEQRQTRWMTSYSLNQFLDARDPSLTVEGYPAPVRVMLKSSL